MPKTILEKSRLPKSLDDEPICKWSRKELEKHLVELVSEVVTEPRFVCTKCGRAAAAKRFLCKSKKIAEFLRSE